MEYVIALSFTCKSIQAGVFAVPQGLVAKASVSVLPCAQTDGKEEYEPADWGEACFAAIRQTVEQSGIDPLKICAITAAGHNSEHIFLGANGKPVCPTPSGRGQRYPEQESRLRAMPLLAKWTGNDVLRESLVAKLLWIRQHEPSLLEKTEKILYGKDWLLYCLTGVCSTDVTTASYSQIFDVTSRNWSSEMLDILALSESLLPSVHESREIIGTLTAQAAAKTGLPEGIPCAAGMTNKACIELSSLCVDSGDDIYTLNRMGNLVTHSTKPYTGGDRRIQCFCSGVQGEYMLVSDTLNAISALQWYASVFCPELYSGGLESTDLAPLEQFAQTSPAAANGVVFLPYIKGEKLPRENSNACGILFGLSDKTTTADTLRAVTEGICCSVMDHIRLVHTETELPVGIPRLRAVGNPDYWMQTLANLSNQPMCYLAPHGGTLVGSAVLAAVTAGLYPNEREASRAMIREGKVYFPMEKERAAYTSIYQNYHAINSVLQVLFKAK